MKKIKNNGGFTFTKLVIAIVLLCLLIAIGIPVIIGIINNSKNKEYENIKKYIESVATKYADDNNLFNDTVTVKRLVEKGYLLADSYITQSNNQIPFIKNPKDSKDNLACYSINIVYKEDSFGNINTGAELNDKIKCETSDQDSIIKDMNSILCLIF